MLRVLLLSFFLFLSYIVSAQHSACGSDALHREMMLKDPQYKLKMDEFETYLRSEEAHKNARTVGGVTIYTIPVVFHVMHKGEAVGTGTNVSD